MRQSQARAEFVRRGLRYLQSVHPIGPWFGDGRKYRLAFGVKRLAVGHVGFALAVLTGG